jgi:putative acetyltransferase
MIIRMERPDDFPAIAEVNRLAFGGDDEAALVDRLRRSGAAKASLVAEADARIVGHLMLSALTAEMDGAPIRTLALAPVAVLPAYQRRTIGSRLVEASIAAARELGTDAIFVLGYKDYYSRFGFSSEKAARTANPFDMDAFMALEITPGVLSGTGSVNYPEAFGLGDARQSVAPECLP